MYPLQLRPSPETQANYAVEWLAIAQEIGQERFSQALVQAVRDSDYFPVVSKIRQLAGMGTKQQTAAGADAAWLYVQDYLRRWPLYDYSDGARRPQGAPQLPGRIAHCVRLIGGLGKIEFADDHSLPFVRKDFAAAWENYDQAAEMYTSLQLESPLISKMLAGGSDKPKRPEPREVAVLKGFPKREPLTEEQVRQKKAEAEKVAEKFKKGL